MTRRAAVVVVGMLAAGVACAARGDRPPQIEVDRTACAHCGMLISEPRFAAAYRAHGSEALMFDDIACLLAAVAREADPKSLRFWFHDVTTSEWMDGERAVFVRSERLRTPMAGGLVAYRDAAAARRGAGEHQGQVISGLADLLADERKGGEL